LGVLSNELKDFTQYQDFGFGIATFFLYFFMADLLIIESMQLGVLIAIVFVLGFRK
jgi:hypothetical protein